MNPNEPVPILRICNGIWFINFKTIASNLGVDPSTDHQTVEIFLSTGTVEKKKYDAGNLNQKLFIIRLVLDNPGIMLHETQKEVNDAFSTDMSEGTICKALHHLNFCRKKMHIAATQQGLSLLCSKICLLCF